MVCAAAGGAGEHAAGGDAGAATMCGSSRRPRRTGVLLQPFGPLGSSADARWARRPVGNAPAGPLSGPCWAEQLITLRSWLVCRSP